MKEVCVAYACGEAVYDVAEPVGVTADRRRCRRGSECGAGRMRRMAIDGGTKTRRKWVVEMRETARMSLILVFGTKFGAMKGEKGVQTWLNAAEEETKPKQPSWKGRKRESDVVGHIPPPISECESRQLAQLAERPQVIGRSKPTHKNAHAPSKPS